MTLYRRSLVKSYTAVCSNSTVKRRTIRYGVAGCMIALVAATIYAIVRLYVLSQRVDSSILLVNVIGFAAIAGILIYLTKKDKDLEEEKLFRD
jgi:threonine/homoserine/homoserine lactone efflux protein